MAQRLMWIKIENEHVRSLKLPWMDTAVQFNDNGTAQVDKEVGRRLIEEVDDIIEHGSTN